MKASDQADGHARRAILAPVEPEEQHELEVLRELACKHGLRLLILHGSRARGDAHPGSDLDLALRGGPDLDLAAFTTDVMMALRRDDVDVVDLDRAGGLLRYRIAREGQVIHDPDDEMDAFRLSAIRFWFDAEPVLRPYYRATLEQLPG